MLAELRVRNLLLIERAELTLAGGLNAITGETGAGKTVLTHALDMLLGGRPPRGLLRPGAEEAYVEGVFTPARTLATDPELADACDRLALDEQEVVLARRITSDGRTRAYVQGRSASAADLQAVGSRLLSFYGQHEHRKLTLASAQLEVLDAFCGKPHLDARAEFERGWARARELRRELEELRERVGARERDLDLLEFELQEIEEAAPSDGEEERLEGEQVRLSAVESLREATWSATEALEPAAAEGEAGALASLSAAADALGQAAGTDERLDALAERLRTLAYEGEDVARELRDYEAGLEADPRRLEQLGERLALLARLRRKHGGSIAAVLEHAERCRREHARLSNAGEATARLERELAEAETELEGRAAALNVTRTQAARELERSVRAELESLAMGEASFEVALGEREALGPRGRDAVEMVIAPNRGVPAGKLRDIASGGELSRVMLALMSVASAASDASTVVFDEIDAGVGGNTARAVGQKLRELSGRRQVVCITHLPQVASLADRHFRVAKRSGGRQTARTEVERLDRGGLVSELCRMLGSDAADGTVRRHAESLLEAA